MGFLPKLAKFYTGEEVGTVNGRSKSKQNRKARGCYTEERENYAERGFITQCVIGFLLRWIEWSKVGRLVREGCDRHSTSRV